jgi:hypothetical protein
VGQQFCSKENALPSWPALRSLREVAVNVSIAPIDKLRTGRGRRARGELQLPPRGYVVRKAKTLSAAKAFVATVAVVASSR